MHQSSEQSSASEREQILLERIIRGDQQALAELFDCQADALYGVAWNIVRDRQDAEELVSELFSRVWMQAERHEPERGSVQAWMRTMLRSMALDRWRRRSRQGQREVHLEKDQRTSTDSANHSPESTVDRQMVQRRTRNVLTELSRSQQKVLDLALFEQLSHQEIAERLAMPLGTVKSHCRRGMAQLRDRMDGFDPRLTRP